MIALALLAILVAQSATGDGKTMVPASAAAILAGSKACIGATVDPAGEDARLQGWVDVTAAQKRGMKTDGRVVTRDNVTLVVKTGIDGGCVVQARTDRAFDKASFYADLGTIAGVQVPADGSRSKVDLPNGELMVVQVGGSFAQLVIANSNGKYAKASPSQQPQGQQPQGK